MLSSWSLKFRDASRPVSPVLCLCDWLQALRMDIYPVGCQLFGLNFFFCCREIITSFESVFDYLSYHRGNFWGKGHPEILKVFMLPPKQTCSLGDAVQLWKQRSNRSCWCPWRKSCVTDIERHSDTDSSAPSGNEGWACQWALQPLASQWHNPCPMLSSLQELSKVQQQCLFMTLPVPIPPSGFPAPPCLRVCFWGNQSEPCIF